MNLYLVTCRFDGVWGGVVYWADCAVDAQRQAIYDGATIASTYRTPAPADYIPQFHGPDFPGRQVYVFYYAAWPHDHGDGECYIAADSREEAWKHAESIAPAGYATRYLRTLTRSVADALLEPGWDQ